MDRTLLYRNRAVFGTLKGRKFPAIIRAMKLSPSRSVTANALHLNIICRNLGVADSKLFLYCLLEQTHLLKIRKDFL